MVATATRPRNATRILLEDFVSGSKNLRVNREAGIIYGVKVLGRTSPNTHGVSGVDGTDYTMEALTQAAPLYEGLAVNVDHPPREKPGKDRSSRDRIGWLSNVQVRPDGIFADLNLLKSDELTPKLFESGERNPALFGLSHNAYGKGEIRGNRYVITEIPEVRSVDVVADAGTVVGLFESKQNMKTLKTLIEAECDDPKEKDAMVKEADNAGLGDMAPAGDSGTDWKQHIVDALGKLMQSSDEADHALAKKLMAVMKPAAVTEADDDKDSVNKNTEEGSDQLRGKNQDGQMRAIQHKDPEGHGQGYNESKEFQDLRRFKDVSILCESEKFTPTPMQRKALEALPAADRKALIKELKESAPRRTTGARSMDVLGMHESRQQQTKPAATFDEFKARVLVG